MDCPKSNERYSKCGGFDKLNHRNANLLDNPIKLWKYGKEERGKKNTRKEEW